MAIPTSFWQKRHLSPLQTPNSRKWYIRELRCLSGAHVFSLQPHRFCCEDVPSRDLDVSSIVSRIPHITLLLWTNAFAPILSVFRTSPIVSLLTPINFFDFMSVVRREIVLILSDSKSEGTGKSSLTKINISYCSSRPL